MLTAGGCTDVLSGYAGPACPPEFSDPTAPRWAAGSGFTVTDNNPSATQTDLGIPKIYVSDPSVNFYVDASFTDDSSTVQLPFGVGGIVGNQIGYGPCTQDSDCPKSSVGGWPSSCVIPFGPWDEGGGNGGYPFGQPGQKYCIPDMCISTWIPGALEGNTAYYDLKMQRWDSSATSCAPDKASPGPGYPNNPDYPEAVIAHDSPSPNGSSAPLSDGTRAGWGTKTGCWVDLPGGVNFALSGPSAGAPPSETAPKDGTVSAKIIVPADLPSVSNYVRVVVGVWEGDNRDPTSPSANKMIGWAPTWASPNSWDCANPADNWMPPPTFGISCPVGGSKFEISGYSCTGWLDDQGNPFPAEYMWYLQHPEPNGAFYYARALKPWQVVVQPQALAQVKVLPYTLIYQPPGKDSSGTFSTTASYGLTMAADTKVANNQSTTIDNKDTDADTESWSMSILKSQLGPIGGGLGIAGTMDNASTTWDHSTVAGVGRSLEFNTGSGTTSQTTWSTTLKAPPNTIPGASGPYGSEPFWGDTFELIVHPQFGFWKIGGQPVISMLAAQGSPSTSTAIPMATLASVEVGDLYSCAQQVGPYADGYPLLPQSTGPVDILSKDDCQQLLQLDPLYNSGQCLSSIDSLIASGRLAKAGHCEYGVDSVTQVPTQCSFSDTVIYSENTTTTAVGSYNTTFQDILISSDAVGMSGNVLFFSGSDTITSVETTTNSANWTVSLQTSVAATAQSSTTVSGTFAHNTYLPPGRSTVNAYQDLLFGTFVWVDPLAQVAPYPDAPPTSLQTPAP